MSQHLPKLLFVGAGNIAQSIIKGIIKARPNAAKQILATAPSEKNLRVLETTIGCQTALLPQAQVHLDSFKPDYVFLCVKPQVLLTSIKEPSDNLLALLLRNIPLSCKTISLAAGIQSNVITRAFYLPATNLVRLMLNTSAEIGSTSALYHVHPKFEKEEEQKLEELFKLVGQVVLKMNDEHLMDVATGVCGSGIAFFYEMIQTISDISVKNGLNRQDATLIAAQLSKSAGDMLLNKRLHPYQLRDEVTSPAGTTIYGLDSWHEHSTGQKIGKAFQASIDRARGLSETIKVELEKNKAINVVE